MWEGGRVGCYIVFSAAQLENAFSCRVGSIFYNKTRSPFVVARPQGRERESERKRENVICSNTTNRTCVEIERFAVFEVEDVSGCFLAKNGVRAPVLLHSVSRTVFF